MTPDDRFHELPGSIRLRIRIWNEHWMWVGALYHVDSQGGAYGSISWGRPRRTWKVHHLVWTLLVGPIPPSMVIDHVCEEKACCRPAHLEVVTREENSRRVHRRQPGDEVPPTPLDGFRPVYLGDQIEIALEDEAAS